MKKMKLILAALAMVGLVLSCASGGASAAKPKPQPKTRVVTANTQSMDGGYFYSFWTNGGGEVKMTLDGANGYSVRWTDCDNFTCGKGWSKGTGRTISYTGYYNSSGGGAFGVYGWTVDPLVEYYVSDKLGEMSNPDTAGDRVGGFECDGATYNIYKHKQIQQPSINGTADFMQFKSIRMTPRTGGTITVQKHFDEWAKVGLELGKRHNYQILLTEGWRGSGSAQASITEVSE
ncbi:MAG: glycoside hydrolase family 11 protein [Spirochaetales bacterium]|nr:glycoside hydrolase family 11 protein [Spirochaetales bacterium]